ncbi:hypothetical protein ACROYT_G010532 [Oculina patagonica]
MTDNTNPTDISLSSFELFFDVRQASGVFLAILAVITVFATIAFLTTLWNKRKRPLKSPTMYFIIGLGIVDVVTGLVIEPVFSICYLTNDLSTCRVEMMELIQFLPRLVMNASFHIMLFLTWSQFMAVVRPDLYKRFMSKVRMIVLIAGIFLYITSFSVLQFTRISQRVLLAIDVYFYATCVPFLLMLSCICLHMCKSKTVLFRRNEVDGGNSEGSMNFLPIPYSVGCVERQFIQMNLSLTVLLFICALPSTVVMHIALKATDVSLQYQENLAIAYMVAEDILFIKFALDPFIFACNFRKIENLLEAGSSEHDSSPLVTRPSECDDIDCAYCEAIARVNSNESQT